MSLTNLRIIGNPKNQFNNAEEILFNHIQHTEVGKENLKAKQRKLEGWKYQTAYLEKEDNGQSTILALCFENQIH